MNFTIVRKEGGTIAWSEDQMKYIINEYKKGKTLSALGREFEVSYGTIRNFLKRNGIKMLGNKHNYPRNEHYFSQINSIEKAYWLGFLYADGCVHEKTNEISITLKESEHLEKFRNAIGAINHKVGSYIDKRWKSKPTIYYFSIKDFRLKSDLIKWGCVPNKSLTISSIPNVPRDYTSHFLRGYYDGDGSLHWSQNTNNFRISFTGTKDFLAEIKKELNVSVSISQLDNNKSYYLQIAGKNQVERILNYLYRNSEKNIRLDRKYNLYKECLQWAHRH